MESAKTNHLYLWPLALGSAFLFCINQWLAINGLHLITITMTVFLVIAIILCVFQASAQKFLPYICFISIFGFPEYSANPYLNEYIAPFGYGKIPAILSLLLMLRIRVSGIGVLVIVLLFVSTIGALLTERLGYLQAEIGYVALLLLALNSYSPLANYAKSIWFGAIERFFYLLMPIVFMITVMGLYDERSGDTRIYFFGHWLGIITALVIYRLASGSLIVAHNNYFRMALIFSTVYICAASYQSAHFFLFIVSALLASSQFFSGRHSRSSMVALLMIIIALPVSGFYVFLNYSSDSWLYLKVSQLLALGSGNFIEKSNSVTIRMAQLVSMFEQGDLFTIFFGRGIASTYLADGTFWEFVIFDEATYPENQIATGTYQYIHESITMLIKWIGVLGLIIVLYALLKKLYKNIIFFSDEILIVAIFIMLFSASVHTGLLVTILLIFNLNSINLNKVA